MFTLPPAMVEQYVKRRQDDIQTLRDSLKKGSTEEFHRIGHQLLGNAKSFGFPELEIIAKEMEQLKPEDLENKGTELLNSFKDWAESKKVL